MILPRDRVYAHLCDTAAARLPIGTNSGIGAALGLAGGTVHHLLSRLSALNMIEVEYTANGKQRRVLIRDTGARTQWSAPHAVSPSARQRGPKLGARAPGWGFQIATDASRNYPFEKAVWVISYPSTGRLFSAPMAVRIRHGHRRDRSRGSRASQTI